MGASRPADRPAPEGRSPAAKRARPAWVKAWGLALAACLIFCARPACVLGHPFGDLRNGNFTDHFSHMNCARLFTRVGSELWKRPVRELLPAIDVAARSALPPDLRNPKPDYYQVDGWPPDKPLVLSWSQNPRMYPAGDMLLVAPLALLYHFTPISFRAINRLLIGLFVLYTFLAFHLLGRRLIDEADDRLACGLSAGFLFVSGVYWALQGFYDMAAVAPLVLCAVYLARRQGLPALFFYCAAAAIHFRAYFLAPWAAYAAWLVVAEREWRSWNPRDWLMAAGVVAFSAASLYPLWLLRPALGTLEVNSPLNPHALTSFNPWIVGAFGLVVVVSGVVIARAGAWLDLGVLGFATLMTFLLHQAYEWHGLVLGAWLGAPLGRRAASHARSVRLSRLAFLVSATFMVFWYHMYLP